MTSGGVGERTWRMRRAGGVDWNRAALAGLLAGCDLEDASSEQPGGRDSSGGRVRGMELAYSEITVQDLVHSVRKERSLALPEFQRPYVWDEEDVAELLRTVISDWPSGTILLLSGQDLINLFSVEAIKGGPAIEDKAEVRSLVLDGQQRLTSLYQAITDSHEKVTFYVDMGRLHQQDQFDDDCLKWLPKDQFPNEVEAAERLIAPIHVLYGESAFDNWLDLVDPGLKDRLGSLFDQHLWALRTYKFPANRLPSDLGLGSLVRIFKKLNRLGEELQTFDLLVALMLNEGFKLRERHEEAKKVLSAIGADLTIKDIELPKLIALEEHLDQVDQHREDETFEVTVGGIREDDVLNLVENTPAKLVEEWDGAVERYGAALRFLSERCGVSARSLLPQDGMILALAIGLASPKPRAGFEADLERWVWATHFAQSYRAGVNTRAVSDARELRKWSQDAEKKPTAIVDLETQPHLIVERLRDSRKGNKIFVRGLASLLVADGAQDWLTPRREGESQELSNHEGAIDVHHVFPDQFLIDRGRPSEMVVNFTPLKASTNRSIGKDAPSTVLSMERFDPDALVKHRIDGDALKSDDLESFISKRVVALRDLIASRVGISAIKDISADPPKAS